MATQLKIRHKNKQKRIEHRGKRIGAFLWANIVLCVVANALIFSVWFDGTTLAWVSSYAAADSTALSTAKLQLDVDAAGPEILKFTTGGIGAQLALLGDIEKNPARKDTIFKDWYLNNVNSFDALLEKTQGDDLAASEHSLVRYQYTFTNDSTVPVYFRIARPETADMDIAAAVFLVGEAPLAPFECAGGWYYIARPLGAGEEIAVTLTALIFECGEEPAFVLGDAEIIQASNNAVYISEDWAHIAARAN